MVILCIVHLTHLIVGGSTNAGNRIYTGGRGAQRFLASGQGGVLGGMVGELASISAGRCDLVELMAVWMPYNWLWHLHGCQAGRLEPCTADAPF